MFLRMKILSPMINFVMQAYSRLQKYIPAITTTLQKVVGWIADGMSKVFDAITPVMDAITGKGNIGDAIGKSINNLVKVLMDAIHKNMPVIMKVMKEVIKGAITIFFQLFKEHPFLMSALVGGKAISGIGSGIGTMVTFASTLKNLGVIKGIPGIGNLGKMLGGLGTKAGGLFGAGLGTAAKAAGPIGLIISALMGGYQGFKAMGPKATTAEKLGGAQAGLMTLGIAPMIDSIFNTKITPILGKNMKNIMLTNPMTAPAGLMLHAFEAFSDKALSQTDQQFMTSIDKKKKAGEKLTAKEIANLEKIADKQAQNHTTWAEGWDKFTKSLSSVFEAKTWSQMGKKISDEFQKVGHKIKMVVGKYLEIPLFNFFFGFQTLIERAIWKIRSYLPKSIGGISKATYKSKAAELDTMERLGKKFKTAAKYGLEGSTADVIRATASATTGSGRDLHTHALLLQEILNEAKASKALKKKSLEEEKKTANNTGAGTAATKELLAKSTKTSEADFFKTFVGSYGLTSFSVKTS